MCKQPVGIHKPCGIHKERQKSKRWSADTINAVLICYNSKILRHQVINKVHLYFASAINNTVTKGITVITHIKNNYRV